MKKKIIIAMVAALAVLAVALGVWQYRRAARFGEALIPDVATVTPENPALGEAVTYAADCLIPWGQYAVEQKFELSQKGVCVARRMNWKLVGVNWRGKRYRLTQEVCPIRTGEMPTGALQIQIKRPDFADGEHLLEKKADLPKVAVKPLDVAPGSEIPIAGAIVPGGNPVNKWWWIGGGALWAVIAGVVIWFVVRRSKQTVAAVLPPWEIARGELAALRQAADTGDRSLPWCVARLTDVVRDYLSARFAWPVRQQTTSEFLNSLRRAKESPLSAEQMRSLGDFMNAADLVKFAKMEPDAGYFHDAMHRAETLIEETQLRETSEAEKEVQK